MLEELSMAQIHILFLLKYLSYHLLYFLIFHSETCFFKHKAQSVCVRCLVGFLLCFEVSTWRKKTKNTQNCYDSNHLKIEVDRRLLLASDWVATLKSDYLNRSFRVLAVPHHLRIKSVFFTSKLKIYINYSHKRNIQGEGT